MDEKVNSKENIAYIRSIASIFSQKWTFEIIFSLANGSDSMGFNELMKNLDGISAAVLSQRLKNLQKWGYVEREVRTGPPTRTRYRLNEKGKSLIKVADFVIHARGKTSFGPEMLKGVSF